MTEQTNPQVRQAAPATGETASAPSSTAARRPPAAPPPRPASARSDAGAVLRRSPDPDRPGSWRAVQPAAPARIVDNAAKRPPSIRPPVVPPRPGEPPRPRIVDSADPEPASAHQGQSTRIVDNVDWAGGQDPHPHIVDTTEHWEDMPLPRPPRPAPGPVPTKLKEPVKASTAGPSGPDDELVRRLRDARKQKVADRAKARGRDPGAGSRQVSAGVTRSEKTHEQYLERGRMLVRRYRREAGLEDSSLDSLDPVEFVNWLFSLKPSLKQTAWRPYRQSAKAILSSIPHEETESAIAMIDSDVAEQSDRERTKTVKPSVPDEGGPRSKLPRRTSTLKEKRIPKEDFDKLVAYLKHFSRSKFAPVLVDWMVAGVSTGLRPIEWQATDMEVRDDLTSPFGRRVWLYVLNAKSTNGRANGLVRTLDLSGFRDDTLRAVQRMSQRGSEWLIAGTYDSMQSQCAQLLYSVCDRLFGGRRVYALYSMRHQFVANAKSLHRPEAVSALVGHVVTDTAVSSYGKKRSCWEPEEILDRADPVPEEVATVRQRLVFFTERVRLQQEAGLLKAPKTTGEEA